MATQVKNAEYAIQSANIISSTEPPENVPNSPNPPDALFIAHPVVENYRKQLEEKEKTISNQARAIDRVTRDNAENKEKIREAQQTIAEAEIQLAQLQQENRRLTLAQVQHQPAQIQPIAPVAIAQNNAGCYQTITMVGRWCKRNLLLLDACTFTLGAILLFCFPPMGFGIVAVGSAVTALMHWIANRFD